MISTLLFKISATTLVLQTFFVTMCFAIFGKDWYKHYNTKYAVFQVAAGFGTLFFLLTFCSAVVLFIWSV